MLSSVMMLGRVEAGSEGRHDLASKVETGVVLRRFGLNGSAFGESCEAVLLAETAEETGGEDLRLTGEILSPMLEVPGGGGGDSGS